MRFLMKSRFGLLICVLLAACTISCGNSGEGSDGDGTFEPVTPLALPPAESATFDVVWEPHVRVAEQDDVLADIDDLNAHDGVFRVRDGSPLLDGLEVGSTVVWPQVGLLSITSLTPSGGFVDVGTEWATFAEAMKEADIEFDHDLTGAAEGRVLGVAPVTAPAPDSEGMLQQPLFDSPVQFTEGGVSYTTDTYKVVITASDSQTTVKYTGSKHDAYTASVDATITGLRAQGHITKGSNDAEPTTVITFPNVRVRGTAKLDITAARGVATAIPPAKLVFPFMVGPMPAFVALELKVVLESTLNGSAEMALSVDFDMTGTVTMSQGPDGPSIGGGITSFNSSNYQATGSTSFTVGQRVGLDSPRLSFGLGRPGIGTAAIYSTLSAEAVANVIASPFSDEYCLILKAGSAVQYGGEVAVLGFSYGVERSLGGIKSPAITRGTGCN